MPIAISIEEFVDRAENGTVIIDVRSPKEFNEGHFPGAINIPLLDDKNRAIVGTKYKNEGHLAAVIMGFELVGKDFHLKIKELLALKPNKKILVYCWRGGLRSNIMSWLFEKAGIEVYLLKGGYKTFRNYCLEIFKKSYNLTILGGKTGSGKTKILNLLKQENIQVIDLECLANHKGSAYGGLGQKPQPSQEYFENLLALELNKLDAKKTIWLEAESSLIGKIQIPKPLFNQMQQSKIVNLLVPKEIRINNIVDEYSNFDIELLELQTKKLEKRLGGLALKNCLEYLSKKDFRNWIDVLLFYYDKTYTQALENRNQNLCINFDMSNKTIQDLIEECKRISI